MGKTQDLYNILRPNAIIGFMHWIWHSDLESTYLKYAFHFTIMLSWDPKGATLAGLAVSRSRMTSNSKRIVFVYTTSILNLKQPIKDWSRTTSAWVIFLQTFNNEQRSQLWMWNASEYKTSMLWETMLNYFQKFRVKCLLLNKRTKLLLGLPPWQYWWVQDVSE